MSSACRRRAGSPLPEDALAELRPVPGHLRGAAVGMLERYLDQPEAPDPMPRAAAAIIAGSAFRPILEQEARLASLSLSADP